MVLEHQGEQTSQWATTTCSIPSKIGCSGEILRHSVRQGEREAGLRDGMTSEVRDRLKALERENRKLRQAREICTALGFWDTGLKPTLPERAVEAVAGDTRPD